MTGITVKVDVRNVVSKLRQFMGLINERELLQAIGNRQVKWMVTNLKEAGSDKKFKTMAANTLIKGRHRTSARHFESTWRSRLQQSFTSKVFGKYVEVGTADRFAAFQHFGTKPYTIKPKSKPRLSFVTVNGRVYAKEVSHPGIPTRGIIPTKKVAETLALKIIIAELKRASQQSGVS